MMDCDRLTTKEVDELLDTANRIRVNCLTSTEDRESYNPASCASCAEILAVLFFKVMHYKVSLPKGISNDRFILSKTHAAPALYSIWAEVGLFPSTEVKDLMRVQGDPTPKLKFVDVTTGNHGQGMAYACGMAFMGKYYDNGSYRVYVLASDGECSQGSMLEAAIWAADHKLDNICLILDCNQTGRAANPNAGQEIETIRRNMDSIGFAPIVVMGHNVEELNKAFYNARLIKNKPTVIIAKTIKGKNLKGIEGLEGTDVANNYKSVSSMLGNLNANIKNTVALNIKHQSLAKEDVDDHHFGFLKLGTSPDYKLGEMFETEKALVRAFEKLSASSKRLLFVDSNVKAVASNRYKFFQDMDPPRVIECYLSEACMIGLAAGLTTRGRSIVFCTTLASCLPRAHDALRTAALSELNIKIVGTYCGITHGRCGISKMAPDDIAIFRNLPNVTIFYPSDNIAMERAIELAANQRGMSYIRVTSTPTPIVFKIYQMFNIGRCIILKSSTKDRVLLIGMGITLNQCLLACDQLITLDVYSRVIDPFTIHPLDAEGITKHALECGGRVVIAEDHYFEGGLGEAILSVFATSRAIIVKHLAIKGALLPGEPEEMLERYKLTSTDIVEAAQAIMQL